MTFVLALVLAAPSPCGPLDLPSVLSLATTRSDEVAIRQGDVVAAEADRALAKAAGIIPISSATLIGGAVPEAHGNILMTTSNTTNRTFFSGQGPFGRLDVSVLQPIWTWGQLSAARDAAEAGWRARELLVRDTVNQVQFRTLQLYWGIVLGRRLLAIAAEVEDALGSVEKRIADSLAAGDGEMTQEDKFRVAVFRSDLNQRKSEAEKGLKLARVALATTLALAEPDLTLKEEALPSSPDASAPPKEQALQEAQKSRPDLLAMDQSILALDSQVQSSRAAELPQLFILGNFTYARAPNRDIQYNPWISDFFNALGGGVVLGLRQNLALPMLKAQADKAEAQLLTVRRQRVGLARLVRLQTDQALAELTAARTKQAATATALSSGRSWFRSAGLNFGAGLTDARGLVEAYGAYVKTQVDSAQATYELILARARLDQVMGRALAKGESACVLP